VLGRNDPCYCGSGRKYKQYCLGKEFGSVLDKVIKYFQKVRAEQEYLKQAGIHINYVEPIVFKGKKVFALGNKVYVNCPPNTTFHTFLIEILKETIDLNWFRKLLLIAYVRRWFSL